MSAWYRGLRLWEASPLTEPRMWLGCPVWGRSPHVLLHGPDDFHAPPLARMSHDRLAERVGTEPMPAWPTERAPAKSQRCLF